MPSDLAIFQEGLTDLAPSAEILCYRGKLENLLPMIQEGRPERDISVTVDYQGLTGGYAHQAARSFAGTGLPGAS